MDRDRAHVDCGGAYAMTSRRHVRRRADLALPKDLAAFLQDRAEIAVAHEGEARLESRSPDETVVSICCLDAAGHDVARTYLSLYS
jgi:hypothetical protein